MAISATSAAAVCRANRARRSPGPVKISARAWLIVWVRSARALRLATISARIASTAPSRPFGAPDRPPRLRSSRGAHGIERIGLTRPAPVLAVGTIDFNNPDTRGCHMPGQASAVASGSLDADQADCPEAAQPAEQPAITGCRGRELLHTG
jgi:hypothetical protein